MRNKISKAVLDCSKKNEKSYQTYIRATSKVFYYRLATKRAFSVY